MPSPAAVSRNPDLFEVPTTYGEVAQLKECLRLALPQPLVMELPSGNTLTFHGGTVPGNGWWYIRHPDALLTHRGRQYAPMARLYRNAVEVDFVLTYPGYQRASSTVTDAVRADLEDVWRSDASFRTRGVLGTVSICEQVLFRGGQELGVYPDDDDEWGMTLMRMPEGFQKRVLTVPRADAVRVALSQLAAATLDGPAAEAARHISGFGHDAMPGWAGTPAELVDSVTAAVGGTEP